MTNQISIQDILSKDSPTIMPGVYDALSAKLAEKAGIEAAAVTGFSVAATSLGVPDVGIMTETNLLSAARTICKATKMPILVDGDTGYGGPLNAMHLIEELISYGAKGVILEDQAWPKRCGHMKGKHVVSKEEHVAKIKAANDARQGEDFFIVARTDSNAIHGLDDALDRGKAYRDAGADVVFVEAPQSIEEIEKISRELDCPLLLNMIEGGKTPILSIEHIRQLGFSIVTYPLTGIFSAAKAVEKSFRSLKETGMGRVDGSVEYQFDEFNKLIGLDEVYALSEKYKY